jgi:tRNA pseudouridine55 synthase
LAQYRGRIQQIPPRFSAIKIDGERAYDLARQGDEFELAAREVDVHDARLIGVPDADHAVIHVVSGKGFYVRALARDLAADLGAEGHISQLRRNRVGSFEARSSVSLADLEARAQDRDALMACLQPLHAVLGDMVKVQVSRQDADNIRRGRDILLMPHVVERWHNEVGDNEDRRVLALSGDEPVALGEVRAGRFEPMRVFSA